MRWSRVDLDGTTIRVDAQMNRLNEVVKAKTKRSLRTIRIDSETVERFLAWRARQRQYEEKAGPAWSGKPRDLVTTTRFGTANQSTQRSPSIVRACDRAGITPHLSAYDLRHSAITMQLENGHPTDKVADWAGASERMIADVYRHKLDEVSDLGPIGGRDR